MSQAGLHFDADYRERCTLRDGREVTLRLVGPQDRERLRKGFEQLSPESRYRRFFTFKPTLSEAELTYLTNIDQEHHVAIGASHLGPDGEEEGLGIARFVRLRDRPTVAEAAIAVLDDVQGQGLGAQLLVRLVAAARERGIERFRFEVLGSNRSAQQFFRDLSSDAVVHCEDGVLVIEWDLSSLAPEGQPAEVRTTAGYDVLRLAARGDLGRAASAHPEQMSRQKSS